MLAYLINIRIVTFLLGVGVSVRAGVSLLGRGNISLHLRSGAVFIRSGSGVRERASLERPHSFPRPPFKDFSLLRSWIPGNITPPQQAPWEGFFFLRGACILLGVW